MNSGVYKKYPDYTRKKAHFATNMSTKINEIEEFIKTIDTQICQSVKDALIITTNNKIWDIIFNNDEKIIIELLENPIIAEFIKFDYLIKIYNVACKKGRLEIIKKIFEREDKDDIIKKYDYNGIVYALISGNKEILKLHIKLNDEKIIKSRYYYVFRWACFDGLDEIVELLIEKYRNILSQMDVTRDYNNYVKYSIKKNFCKIVKNAKSENEKSANYIKIVRLLIDLYGDKIASKDIIDEFDEKNDEKNDKKNDENWKLIHKELKEKYLEKMEKINYLLVRENNILSNKFEVQKNKLNKIALVLSNEN